MRLFFWTRRDAATSAADCASGAAPPRSALAPTCDRIARPSWQISALLISSLIWTAAIGQELTQSVAESHHLPYALAGLVVLQTILIAVLLIQEYRRRRVQLDTQRFYGDMTHAARLILLGELTASIAHQVTQPLSAILSNVETAEMLLDRGEPSLTEIREILADIRRDNVRATDVVRRLRTLLRKADLQFERTDINALVGSVLSLIRPEVMRRHIDLRTSLEPELPRVAGDPAQLQQVLLNLLINAMDALSRTPRAARSLDIRTALHDPGCIEVAISDTGHGMSPAELTRIFDSYFTTKEEGLGLGLSIARSIVQAHGGTLWAENPVSGGGSVFRFTIPLQAA